MGYLSCRADSSVATCRSITAISPLPISRRSGSGSGSSRPPDAAPPPIERFSYADLEAATSHFADAALLGRGSHGAVYKAVLPCGRAVAVKRPSPRRPEVDNEIRILSSLRGPRLVNLLGFSDPGPGPASARLLVVEYMPNGTLYDLLHSSPRPPGWPRRLRLALQTARALRALHDADPPVVHRDVKSANVLLDANLDARLGDFGLALRVPTSTSSTSATPAPPAGTLGYLDPAYVTPDSLSTKTDVFSFGILLLEIMSGRRAIDVHHSPPSVVDWAVPLLRRGKVASLFDPRVPPPRDPAARKDLAALAASCVRSRGDRRPSMADVVDRLAALSKSLSAKVWNGRLGNPCAVVDVHRTISKRAAASSRAAESIAFDDDDKEAEADDDAYVPGIEPAQEEQVPLVGANKQKPPRPLKNGIVLSERKNLLELMARIDGVAGQRFGISRARTVRAASELIEKDAAVVLLRRNQTVKVIGSEVLPKSDRLSRFEVKIKHPAGKEEQENVQQGNQGKVRERTEKIQDSSTSQIPEKEQERIEKIQDCTSQIREKSSETLVGKAEQLHEETEQELGRNKRIQEKQAEQTVEKVESVQENEEKIRGAAERSQENTEKTQGEVDKIQFKTGES